MVIIDVPATAPATPRRRRGLVVTILVWLVIVPGLIWVVIRLGGWVRGPLVQLLAFTPYVAAWSVIPLVLALATRRWIAASIALAGVLGFGVAVCRPRTGRRGSSSVTSIPRSTTRRCAG